MANNATKPPSSRKSSRRRRRKPAEQPVTETVALEAPFKKLLLTEAGESASRVALACRILDIESLAAKVPGRDSRFAADCDGVLELPDAGDPQADAATIAKAAREAGVDVILPGYEGLRCLSALQEELRESGITIAQTRLTEDGQPLGRQAMLDICKSLGIDSVDSQRIPASKLVEIFEEHGGPLIARSDIVGDAKPCRLLDKDDAESAAVSLPGPDGYLWVEEPIAQRRRFDVSVIRDVNGDCAALVERDSSAFGLGLREAPSPTLMAAADGEALREALFEVATRLWSALGAFGVGEVMFGYNVEGKFFIEDLATGISPEQVLTEWVCRIGLVEWQLRVHAGQPLTEEVYARPESGHAFLAHVRGGARAETEGTTFGEVLWPPTPSGSVRVLSPYSEGSDLPEGQQRTLLARISTFGAVRHQALLTLDRILAGTEFPPLDTNIPRLREVLSHEGMRFGQYDSDSRFTRPTE